jgi:hypothetical protein
MTVEERQRMVEKMAENAKLLESQKLKQYKEDFKEDDDNRKNAQFLK